MTLKSPKEIAYHCANTLDASVVIERVVKAITTERTRYEELKAENERLKVIESSAVGQNAIKDLAERFILNTKISELTSLLEKVEKLLKDSKDAVITLKENGKRLNKDNAEFWLKDIEETLLTISKFRGGE